MSTSTNKYVCGDTALSGTYEQALGKALGELYPSKSSVIALVKDYFAEAIFEINWSGTFHTAIQTLITWCKSNKKVHQLIQRPIDDGMQTRFGSTLSLLLGAGVIVPADEAPTGKYKDGPLTRQLPPDTRQMIAGQIISAVGKKSTLMEFVEAILPDLSGKVDWTDIAKAARSLVNLSIEGGRLGLLIEKLIELHDSSEIQMTQGFLLIHGVIMQR